MLVVPCLCRGRYILSYFFFSFFSLSFVHSRVGVVGPNGAGKSTLIKLVTVRLDVVHMLSSNHFLQGETVPQEGYVYKHPNLRVGYVSQHATHHIGMSWIIPHTRPLLMCIRTTLGKNSYRLHPMALSGRT